MTFKMYQFNTQKVVDITQVFKSTILCTIGMVRWQVKNLAKYGGLVVN